MNRLFVIIALAMLLFGCTSGTTTTPTPTATPHTNATATPVVTPEANATATPSATATPETELKNWEGLYGCNQVGISYTYEMTSNQTSVNMSYSMADGGVVNGTDTVLKTSEVSVSGMTMTIQEWDSKVGCRCVKMASNFAGQVLPGQCPATGVGEAAGAQTTIVAQGTEVISVPAYTGLATKYVVTSTSSDGTYSAYVWSTPSIKVPLMINASGTMTTLVSYAN